MTALFHGTRKMRPLIWVLGLGVDRCSLVGFMDGGERGASWILAFWMV